MSLCVRCLPHEDTVPDHPSVGWYNTVFVTILYMEIP